MDGVKAYFRCLLRALRDIHARGIIHRDVKPANFLYDPRTGVGTLCDFGLACVRGRSPTCACIMLTPRSISNVRAPMVNAYIHLPSSSIPTAGYEGTRSSTLRAYGISNVKRGKGQTRVLTQLATWRRTLGTYSPVMALSRSDFRLQTAFSREPCGHKGFPCA